MTAYQLPFHAPECDPSFCPPLIMEFIAAAIAAELGVTAFRVAASFKIGVAVLAFAQGGAGAGYFRQLQPALRLARTCQSLKGGQSAKGCATAAASSLLRN